MKLMFLLLLLKASLFSSAQAAEKALFGLYPREEVTNPYELANRIVGRIGHHCTGTLIGPRQVLTAAHCAYDLLTSQFRNDLFFTPGQVREGSPFGPIGWKQIYLPRKFKIDSNQFHHDFAVLELNEDIGKKLGWAGFKVQGPQATLTISLSGYPLDQDPGSLWKALCPASLKKEEILYHCDTFAGMSGSGVFEETRGDHARFVIGVHVYGDRNQNGAARITESKFKMIQMWMAGKTNKETRLIKNTQ